MCNCWDCYLDIKIKVYEVFLKHDSESQGQDSWATPLNASQKSNCYQSSNSAINISN